MNININRTLDGANNEIIEVQTSLGLVVISESQDFPGRLEVQIEHDGEPASIVCVGGRYVYGTENSAYSRLIEVRAELDQGTHSPEEMIDNISLTVERADLPGYWIAP